MYFDSIICIMVIIYFFCYVNDINFLIDNLYVVRYIVIIKNVIFNFWYWEIYLFRK